MSDEIKKMDEEIREMEHQLDHDYEDMADNIRLKEKQMEEDIIKNQEILKKYVKENHL